MAENRNVEEYLHEACRQEKKSLLAHGPDFQKIEKEALAKFKLRKKARVRKILIQTVAAVAAVLIIANSAVILFDIPDARAYRETVRKYFFNFVNTVPAEYDDKLILQTTEALKDAQDKVPYPIPFPHWLPEGYEVVNTYAEQDTKDVYSVRIQYDKPNADEIIEIDITSGTDFANSKPPPDEPPVEKKEIAGYDVYIMDKGDNPESNFSCMFYYKDLSVFMSGPFDINVFTQILVSFQQ